MVFFKNRYLENIQKAITLTKICRKLSKWRLVTLFCYLSTLVLYIVIKFFDNFLFLSRNCVSNMQNEYSTFNNNFKHFFIGTCTIKWHLQEMSGYEIPVSRVGLSPGTGTENSSRKDLYRWKSRDNFTIGLPLAKRRWSKTFIEPRKEIC